MAVFQGTREIRYMNFKNSDESPMNIDGWEFRATLRRTPTASDSLGELTMANGGFVIVDAVNGRGQHDSRHFFSRGGNRDVTVEFALVGA